MTRRRVGKRGIRHQNAATTDRWVGRVREPFEPAALPPRDIFARLISLVTERHFADASLLVSWGKRGRFIRAGKRIGLVAWLMYRNLGSGSVDIPWSGIGPLS